MKKLALFLSILITISSITFPAYAIDLTEQGSTEMDSKSIDYLNPHDVIRFLNTTDREFYGLPPKSEIGFSNSTSVKKVTSTIDMDNTAENNDELLDRLYIRDCRPGADLSGLPPTSFMLASNEIQTRSMTDEDEDIDIIKGSSIPSYLTQYNQGGHYYAFSPTLNSYTSAYAMITLPTSSNFNNANNTRTAYLALGVYGCTDIAHGIDIGISNQGDGWAPVYYDVGVGSCRFDQNHMAPSTAVYAEISCRVISTTVVRMYVAFLDASGNEVGTVLTTEITTPSGNFMIVNNLPKCKYYRFASLIPNSQPDNVNDGSYMTGVQMNYCQLFKKAPMSRPRTEKSA